MKFLTIKNKLPEKAEIYINGDIVDDSWNFGWEDDPSIYPLNIKNMLDDVKGKDIDIHINSGGGHVFAGIAISNMIKNHNGHTKAIIDGLAGSIASVIAFGCDEIQMPNNAFLMMHKPFSLCMGNSDDMLKMAETLDNLQEGILNTYLNHAKENISKEEINELINKETWLNGKEASNYFNITTKEELKVASCVSDMFKNFKNIPKNFETKNSKYDDIQKMNMEINLSLIL